jgi:hypothetical protein
MLANIPIIAITTNSSIRVKDLIELAFALRAMAGWASNSINVKRDRIVLRKFENRARRKGFHLRSPSFGGQVGWQAAGSSINVKSTTDLFLKPAGQP